MDCQIGRFTAHPRPSAKVSARSKAGVMAPTQVRTASARDNQTCMTMSSLRLSTMSASATRVGEGDSEVMSHAAATPCIQAPTLAAMEAIQRVRKTGRRRGSQADTTAGWLLATGGSRRPAIASSLAADPHR